MRIADLTVTQEDLVLFLGIENEISAGHIARIANRLNEPVGTALRRLQQFASLGFVLPAADPDQFADLIVTHNDLILLSKNLDEMSPWIDKEVSSGHIIKAAEKLNEPVETILQRIQRFAPLGFEALS